MNSKIKITVSIIAIVCMILLLLISLGTISQPVKATDDYIDISSMNNNIAYSQVCNMINAPTFYEGKTIKASGLCINEQDDQKNYSILIKDALGCCSQKLAFVLKNKTYIINNEKITIEGVFATYQTDNQTYYHLIETIITN